MSKKDNRLTYNDDDYIRPNVTYTDKLTAEEIKEKLRYYKQVKSTKELSKIPLHTQIKYFKIDNNDSKFRIGGRLKSKKNADTYIVLYNNKKSWSVDTQHAIFFKKMTAEEMEKQSKERIQQLENQISDLKSDFNKVKKENKK